MKLQLFIIIFLTTFFSWFFMVGLGTAQDNEAIARIIAEEFEKVQKRSEELVSKKQFDSARALYEDFIQKYKELSPDDISFELAKSWIAHLDQEVKKLIDKTLADIKKLMNDNQYGEVLKVWLEMSEWEIKSFKDQIHDLLESIVKQAIRYHQEKSAKYREQRNFGKAIKHLREWLFYTNDPELIQSAYREIIKLTREAKQRFFEEHIASKKDDIRGGKFNTLIEYYDKLQKQEPFKEFSEYLNLFITYLKSLQKETTSAVDFAKIDREWRQILEKTKIDYGMLQRPPEAEGCAGCQQGHIPCVKCLSSGRVARPCAKCVGTGQTPCAICQGSGQVPCQRCAGSGQKKCGKCVGKGEVTRQCTRCGGVGWIIVVGQGNISCPACEGKGRWKASCPKCDGSKLEPCGDCKGSTKECKKCQDGLIQCLQCKGNKEEQVTCPDCDGSGCLFCLECKGKGWYFPFEKIIRKHIQNIQLKEDDLRDKGGEAEGN